MATSKMFLPLHHPTAYQLPKRISQYSAWVEHVPFAMALVEMLRPRLIVELGAHWGDSYCAFCQAVQHLGLPTRCFAIDTWRGDALLGDYGDEVLNDLRTHHDPAYGSFSTLVQSDFDSARPQFEDGSIDLFHIDGLHTYEAVRHDFESWLPKLSPRAVVLFHDTAERAQGFGVWKLWSELSGQFPSFEFSHCSGLGVLAVGPDVPQALSTFLAFAATQAEEVRSFYRHLGQRAALYRLTVQLAGHMHAAQSGINAWKRSVGLETAQGTDRFEDAKENPTEYAQHLVSEVQRLIAALQSRGTDSQRQAGHHSRVLNVGGGSRKIPIPKRYDGWEHVLLDIDPRFGPDLVMDARALIHQPPETYDAVYCGSNLEHYHPHDAETVVRGIFHVLKPDGFAEIRVPDLQLLMQHVVSTGMDVDDVLYHVGKSPILVRDVLYGYHREIEKSGNDFFAHKSGYSAKSLGAMLTRCGFPTVMTGCENDFEVLAFAFKQSPSRQRLESILAAGSSASIASSE